MQWLQEHSIANMYGPKFLVVYGTVIVLTLGTCWWFIQRRAKPLYRESQTPPVFASAKVMQATARTKLIGACVIVGLGGYKLLVALNKGRYNVGFLILMCIISLCVLFTMQPSTGRKNTGSSSKDEFASKGPGQ